MRAGQRRDWDIGGILFRAQGSGLRAVMVQRLEPDMSRAGAGATRGHVHSEYAPPLSFLTEVMAGFLRDRSACPAITASCGSMLLPTNSPYGSTRKPARFRWKSASIPALSCDAPRCPSCATSSKDLPRRSGREHVHFLNIAAGSLAETRYLVDLSARLGLLSQGAAAALEQSAAAVASQLETMIRRLLGRESREKR